MLSACSFFTGVISFTEGQFFTASYNCHKGVWGSWGQVDACTFFLLAISKQALPLEEMLE